MQTGKPTRLAERLNADLEALRQTHLDLMNSQLQSFESGLNTIVTDALSTTKSDINTFQQNLSSTLDMMQRSMRPNWRRWIPLVTGIIFGSLILGSLMAWGWQSYNLKKWGLMHIKQAQTEFLIIDPTVIWIRSCTSGETHTDCLVLRKD